MSLFGHKKEESTAGTSAAEPAALSGENTVGQWLDHPTGGVVLREMLTQAGQNESVLKIVRRMSMNKLIAMSSGRFTQEMLDGLVAKANSGEVAPTAPAPTTATNATSDEPLPEWEERIVTDRFKGKTVVVTGAGSGIGQATASRIAREGGRVIAVDISKERLAAFKKAHSKHQVETVTGDITSDASVKAIVTKAGKTIDGLANVAGVMDNFTPLHEMNDDVWERVMGVNVNGMMKLSRAVLPVMLAKRSGAIVNVGSEASLKASAAGVAYTTSKHAVVGLTKSLAFMYGPSGIRSNVVTPGAVLTNIEARYESELGAERTNSIIATAPDAANANQLAASITFLLSDDSTNVNGAVLPSDGGWSVQ